jgi:ribosome biogenesis GTPase / thiamine phosphate phosphatase
LPETFEVMKGTVLRSTGAFYDVLGSDGKRYNCRVRGKIRLEGIKESNPVAVGDRVLMDLEQDLGSITEILPRRNHVLRQSVKKTGHSHVLAANVDQLVLIATLAFPKTSLGFIDRCLVSAEAFRIPQVLVINKIDLLDADGHKWLEQMTELYGNIGVKCHAVSALYDDVSAIVATLKGKTTLVTGHSGVGKSTLLNKISPAIQQAVADISRFSEKGKHTTTFAEMFTLEQNTFVIDTPGVKEWGLVDMNVQEISDYFPEMRDLRLQCKFGSRCIHINEPNCAIINGVEMGSIGLTRYESYLSMVMGGDNRK